MAKIPKYEQATDFRPAMMPFSTGDGYEAPGRGLQKIGQGIAALGQGIGSLQGQVDQYDEHNAKLAALKFNDDMDRDDAEAQAAFNPDKDDVNAWIAGRHQRLQERSAGAYDGITSQRGRQLLDLHIARKGNAARGGYQQFGIGMRQQKQFNDTGQAITDQFNKLGAFTPGKVSADAEAQAGYAGAGSPGVTQESSSADQMMAATEQTMRAAASMIDSMPASPQHKARLIKHTHDLAMAALGRKQDAWPAVEAWMKQQREAMPAAGAQAANSSRGGAPADYLLTKLAPGAEGRRSDVTNLNPVKQDRLAAFIAAAEDAGHDIRILSGHRDAARQAVLWRDALAKYGSAAEARKHVAPPGGSTHQSGEAVDLQYQDRGSGLGGRRTAAVDWAHKNASRFGLQFPIGHEDWHIEPVEARAGGRRYGGQYDANKKYWQPQQTQQAAGSGALSPAALQAIAQIESSGNPTKQTGSYKGLFQLSDADFRKYGGTGSIFDPEQNTKAATAKFAALSQSLQSKLGRPPTAGEVYLAHQQGEGGAAAHMANPDRPAWENMASTAEGRQKGAAWAKQAIWGNLPDDAKRQFGSVERVTSRQFADYWTGRVEQSAGSAPAGAPPVSQRGVTRYAGLTPPQGTATDARAPNTIPGQQVAQAPSSPSFSALRSELSESLQKAAPAMKEAYRKQVEQRVEAIEGMGMYTVDQPTMDRLRSAAEKSGDPVLIQRAQLLPLRAQIAKATAQAPPEALTAEAQRLRAQAASGPTTPQQLAAIEQLEAQSKETEKGLSNTPYEHATKVQMLPGPVAPLSPAMNPEEFRGALEQRAVARTVIESQMGRDIPLLQGREQQDVIDFLKNPQVTVDQRAAMLRTMYDTLGKNRMIRDAQTIFGQDASEMVAISWVAAQNGDPMFLKDALRGYDLRQTKGFVSRLPSNDDIRFRMDASLTKAFIEMPESAYNAMAAARLAYEVRAERAQIDPKQKGFSSESGRIWDAAMQAAMGRNEDRVGGRVETYGGVVEGTVIPPWLKANGGMDEIRQVLRFGDLPPNLPQVVPNTDEQPLLTMPNEPQQNEAMTAAGQSRATAVPQGGSPMAVPGWGPISAVPDVGSSSATAPEPKGQFAGMPGTPDGKPIPMSVIRAATPVWIGGSNYKLRTGYDSMGNAVYVGVLGHPDLKYILNMDGVRKRLENVQPGGRPRVREGTFRVRE